jgi:hypothetical protein
MFDDTKTQYGIFKLEPSKDQVTPMGLEVIGQALLIRKQDFEFK